MGYEYLLKFTRVLMRIPGFFLSRVWLEYLNIQSIDIPAHGAPTGVQNSEEHRSSMLLIGLMSDVSLTFGLLLSFHFFFFTSDTNIRMS